MKCKPPCETISGAIETNALQLGRKRLHYNATSWDNGCQKRPLLTPFLTPVAPRRARDRVPSILALGLFFLGFHAARNGSPSPFHIPFSLSPNRKLQSKNGTPPFLHFCQAPLAEFVGGRQKTAARGVRFCRPSHSYSDKLGSSVNGTSLPEV